MFGNMFKKEKAALNYYASMRFKQDGMGVTKPCQLRYVKYFSQVLVER